MTAATVFGYHAIPMYGIILATATNSRVSDEALIIPPEILSPLRQAAFWELGHASEGLVAIAQTPGHLDHPEWYEEQLARLDAVRALLDVLGWAERGRSSEVRLDARRHGTALSGALSRALEDAELAGVTVRHDRRRRHCRRLLSIVAATVEGCPDGACPRIPSIAPGVGYRGRHSDIRSLTPREIEILVHLSRSRRYAEIAAVLCRDLETVRTHARRIRHKLGVRRSRDLVGLYVPERYDTGTPAA
jgi:DNA-binding CsgD family transcriptional regulator